MNKRHATPWLGIRATSMTKRHSPNGQEKIVNIVAQHANAQVHPGNQGLMKYARMARTQKSAINHSSPSAHSTKGRVFEEPDEDSFFELSIIPNMSGALLTVC